MWKGEDKDSIGISVNYSVRKIKSIKYWITGGREKKPSRNNWIKGVENIKNIVGFSFSQIDLIIIGFRNRSI